MIFFFRAWRTHGKSTTPLSLLFLLVLCRRPRFHGESVDLITTQFRREQLIDHLVSFQQGHIVKSFANHNQFEFCPTAVTITEIGAFDNFGFQMQYALT
jgi:hypothetical protein